MKSKEKKESTFQMLQANILAPKAEQGEQGHVVYLDMCADLFHYGHVNQLRNCRRLAQGGKVLVGIHSDETIKSYKRNPILNMLERIHVVESCRYVDMVIPDAPLSVTEDFIRKYRITRVITSDQRTEAEIDLMYAIPRQLGILCTAPHTREISTTDIIQRILHTRIS